MIFPKSVLSRQFPQFYSIIPRTNKSLVYQNSLLQININAKEEDLLWKSGQLGHLTALALLNVNLLNLVKRMGIKGRKDLYMLRVEDFEVRWF